IAHEKIPFGWVRSANAPPTPPLQYVRPYFFVKAKYGCPYLLLARGAVGPNKDLQYQVLSRNRGGALTRLGSHVLGATRIETRIWLGPSLRNQSWPRRYSQLSSLISLGQGAPVPVSSSAFKL